jgi:hypothetical protein
MKNNVEHFIDTSSFERLVNKSLRRESFIPRADFEALVLPGLQKMAIDRLDELTRATMTTQGLDSYQAAFEIVKKENPSLLKMAYEKPKKFMAELAGAREDL